MTSLVNVNPHMELIQTSDYASTHTAAFQTMTPSAEYAGRSHMAWIYAAEARKPALQTSTGQI